MRLTALSCMAAALVACAGLSRSAGPAARPNVILVITDDQGYGDVGAHGNSMIRTPHLDRLWAESVRLTDFHVDPTCSPTRCALMSGRYSTRTGVWHTIMGRSMMDPREVTLAEMFAAHGYRTGMYGKWHLGENYPCRPRDQGFQDVVCHGGGGVGNGPDWWGNDYFDDTYRRNGKWEAFKGYCTDVWFDEAIRFVRENRDRPFFVYLSTNAPHGPYLVDEKYSKPYAEKGVPDTMAKFYGMIENIDENMGRLRGQIAELGLSENTILIFMTDNGTAAGVAGKRGGPGKWDGFNAGMRGQKGSEYDGGHRVPFFIHWPAGKLAGGRDVTPLAAHIDVLPTLADLCGLRRPDGPPIDGTSLKAALYGDGTALRGRTLFVHSQRILHPEKWRKCAVMTERHRLVNGKELYDIKADPGQKTDIAAGHPGMVEAFREAYEGWWKSLEPVFGGYVRIGVGSDRENPVRLSAHDWLCEDQKDSSWHQAHVQRGHLGKGPWALDVERAGEYEIALYRWPEQLGKAMDCTQARVKVGEIERSMEIKPGDVRAAFRVALPKGPAFLETWLTRGDGKVHGAYFAHVRRLD